MTTLAELETPCLVLDRGIVARNVARMRARAKELGVALRAHMKTAKSQDVARMLRDEGPAPITVSTLREAEYFFGHGVTDILYAVGITPQKLDRVMQLRAKGCRLLVVLDSLAMATAVAEYAERHGAQLEVMIEVDTDGHRAGIDPADPELARIAERLDAAVPVAFVGVMTHAGDSYNCHSTAAVAAHAEQERAGCVGAAETIRGLGIACDVVSVGSTPTATFAEHLQGVTEMRPGNFVFYDLFQVGLGVCRREDIGVWVLGSVIGHSRAHNRVFTDAGGLALSKDLSTSEQPEDLRYGVVAGAPDLVVVSANQEHGILTTRTGEPLDFSRYPVGSQVAILPVHSCMTAAAHESYHVVEGDDQVQASWSRCNRW